MNGTVRKTDYLDRPVIRALLRLLRERPESAADAGTGAPSGGYGGDGWDLD
jgi:hypothetical protein